MNDRCGPLNQESVVVQTSLFKAKKSDQAARSRVTVSYAIFCINRSFSYGKDQGINGIILGLSLWWGEGEKGNVLRDSGHHWKGLLATSS